MGLHTEALGPVSEIALGRARIRYHDSGSGSPVVFVHGLLVNADLWRHVVPQLREAGFRCLAPDWPLGAHALPVPEADLSPPALADLIGAFLDELDLTDVTVVASDAGGALTQILMTRDAGRVARVVLTPSDSYERFLPAFFAALPPLARIPGAVELLSEVIQRPVLRPVLFSTVARAELPREVLDSWTRPCQQDSGVRADLRRFLRGVSKRHTLAAARYFPHVTVPVLLAWAREDLLFPERDAYRLAQDLAQATVTIIDDSRTFVAEDQPGELAARVVDFARGPQAGEPSDDDGEPTGSSRPGSVRP